MSRKSSKRYFFLGLFVGYVVMSLVENVTFHKHIKQENLRKAYVRLATETPESHHKDVVVPDAPPCLPSKSAEKNFQTSEVMFPIKDLMDATQVERKTNIETVCRRLYPNKTKNTKYIHARNFVSQNYKLIVCDILKCGYSGWIAGIYVMENFYTVDDYVHMRIRGKKVMLESHEKIRLGGIKSNQMRMKVWQESLKVMMVRNPFARLVSAYYDKMLTTSPGYNDQYEPMSQSINKQFKHLRHNVIERNQSGDGTATFEDFVNYLVTVDNFKADGHWTPFVETCKPCDAQYDYIIKFETLNNDMEYLKQKLNISEYHQKAVFPPGNYKTNNDLVEKAFKTIPKALAGNLYEKYRNDFELFNYDRPEFLL